MQLPTKRDQESILDYAERLSELYVKIHDIQQRKSRGQILTTRPISRFMAEETVYYFVFFGQFTN